MRKARPVFGDEDRKWAEEVGVIRVKEVADVATWLLHNTSVSGQACWRSCIVRRCICFCVMRLWSLWRPGGGSLLDRIMKESLLASKSVCNCTIHSRQIKKTLFIIIGNE